MDGQSTSVLPDKSSPSSEGGSSHHSSPDTTFTAFSIENTHDVSKTAVEGSIKVLLPPAFTLQGVPTRSSPNSKPARSPLLGIHDPFTTSSNLISLPSTSSVGLKLSPTATSFTPSSVNNQSPSSEVPRSSSTSVYQPSNRASAVSLLIATSIPDNTTDNTKLKKSMPPTGLAAVALSPIGPRATTISTGLVADQESSKVRGNSSRLLMISQITTITTPKELSDIFSVSPLLHVCSTL